MIKNKYLILTLILSLLSINKTYASCTQEEINEFKKIEDQYKMTYEFNTNNKTYTITLKRPNPDTYDYKFDFITITATHAINNKIECIDPNEKISTCKNFPSGKYLVQIVGQTETCKDVLKETTLELAKYNEYSEDPLCKGNEEFYLCQPTYDKEIDRETFESRINTYRRTKTEKQEQPPENVEEDKLIEYIKENLIQIIIVVIFLILILITFIITAKSIRKSRRLE